MKSALNISVFCALMSLSFIPLSAQTTPADFTVQGNVRGSEGVLLPGATLIVIQNNRLGVSTDGFGAFRTFSALIRTLDPPMLNDRL